MKKSTSNYEGKKSIWAMWLWGKSNTAKRSKDTGGIFTIHVLK